MLDDFTQANHHRFFKVFRCSMNTMELPRSIVIIMKHISNWLVSFHYALGCEYSDVGRIFEWPVTFCVIHTWHLQVDAIHITPTWHKYTFFSSGD